MRFCLTDCVDQTTVSLRLKIFKFEHVTLRHPVVTAALCATTSLSCLGLLLASSLAAL